MKLWIDAKLSPALARWITKHFEGIEALAVRELGLRDAEDAEIFEAARQANVVVMSKDSVFVDLVNRLGPPPQVVWVRCGNTSDAQMRVILSSTLSAVVA
ncbi:MAG: DUF5615 family PIN-like protein, partial [Gammaproteobacteria bacterium]|nr:DUF5615 family PIN-like protein [Gammaproteobacteria bacterium]